MNQLPPSSSEQASDSNETLQKLRKSLSPDGRLIVAVPNFKSWDAQHYKEFWAGFDVPRHLYHFSQHSIAPLLKKHELILKEIVPMKLDAY